MYDNLQPPFDWSQQNCVVYSFPTMFHNLLVKVSKCSESKKMCFTETQQSICRGPPQTFLQVGMVFYVVLIYQTET